jgi:muramoyltetrapeptide carboxypeptidase
MRIGIVAPSGAFDRQRLDQSMELVRDWGFELVPGPHLFSRHRYTAGTAVERGADLAWALTAPGLDAAWFVRGGFGTIHLLSDLPWTDMDGRPVFGFSDATALFCAMAANGVKGAVHSPVLYSLSDHVDDESRAAMRLALGGLPLQLNAEQLSGSTVPIQGPVVGGNLCTLASLAGTPWALRAHGSILVLEDVAEPPYKLDRLLTQLRYSGALDGVLAVVLGEFTGCTVPEDADWSLRDLLLDLLKPLGVPIWSKLPVGHGSANRPWYHGGRGVLADGGLRVERD